MDDLIYIANIKNDVLIKYLKKYFYDINVINVMDIFITNIITYPYFINLYFNNLKVLYENDENTIMLSNFADVKHAFIIKTSNNIDNEYRIIDKIINNLRIQHNIYNFVYTFGLFNGTPLIKDDDNKVISYCENSNFNNKYIIQENIYPNIKLSDYINDNNNNFYDWLNIYVQVVFALHTSLLNYKFIHNDISNKKILIRTLDKELILKYTIFDNIITMKTKNLAIIIDYELNNINQLNQKKYRLTKYNVLNVAYKLLVSYILNTTNDEYLKQAYELSKIFAINSKEDIKSYTLNNELINNNTFQEFMLYILSTIDLYNISSTNKSIGTYKFLQKIDYNSDKIIKNIDLFYLYNYDENDYKYDLDITSQLNNKSLYIKNLFIKINDILNNNVNIKSAFILYDYVNEIKNILIIIKNLPADILYLNYYEFLTNEIMNLYNKDNGILEYYNNTLKLINDKITKSKFIKKEDANDKLYIEYIITN